MANLHAITNIHNLQQSPPTQIDQRSTEWNHACDNTLDQQLGHQRIQQRTTSPKTLFR